MGEFLYRFRFVIIGLVAVIAAGVIFGGSILFRPNCHINLAANEGGGNHLTDFHFLLTVEWGNADGEV